MWFSLEKGFANCDLCPARGHRAVSRPGAADAESGCAQPGAAAGNMEKIRLALKEYAGERSKELEIQESRGKRQVRSDLLLPPGASARQSFTGVFQGCAWW